jgi:hypothetical protein
MAHAPPAFSAPSRRASRHDRPPDTHDPAPSYQAEHYGDVWKHWTAVDNANQRVTETQAALAELEPELQAKTKEGERLKERRWQSNIFARKIGIG